MAGLLCLIWAMEPGYQDIFVAEEGGCGDIGLWPNHEPMGDLQLEYRLEGHHLWSIT